MIVLKDIVKHLSSASTKDLENLLTAVQKELHHRHLNSLLDYIPDVIDTTLAEAVFRECESLNLPISSRKSASQWLSPVNEPYWFTDSEPIHRARDITRLPAISEVKDIFCSLFKCKLDACLVLMYSSTGASTSLHDDSELIFDHSQPMANLSLGSTRRIEFLANSGGKLVRAIVMRDRSVVLMKPGTQQSMKHRVPAEANKSNNIRYSLSYRALAKRPSSLPAKPISTAQNGPNSSKSVPTTPSSAQDEANNGIAARHVCLIAGDSFAARLDTGKLGRKCVDVVSVAKGGAKIHHVMDQLRDFKAANSSVIVDKICISVGTNNIRDLDNGAHNLKYKFKSLCSLIKELYPSSIVYFQLLLPLPCKNLFDWRTNSDVLTINRIIINECIFRRFHVLDAFQAFCMVSRDCRYPELRNNRLFVGSNIHPSEARGIGVLAKLYLRAIHSKFFDPFILQ